jgi:predicted MFS family arabinose efflux permease
VSFVGAWVLGGLLTDGYDPLRDAISRLAAEGAATRPLMTSGMVAFGVLVPVWARTLGDRLDSPWLRRVVTTAGVSTLAVAALPLTQDGGTPQDALHAVAAGAGYAAMAATPLLAAPLLRRRGHRRAAAASLAVGAVSVASLVGTLVVGENGALGSGGLQRLGLTAVDAWHVVAAAAVLGARRRTASSRPRVL